MAHLLGSKLCLESLQHDVKDIQEIINDVTSRVGQVKYQSWKFPDKLSIDVDIDQLLNGCVYSEEDEEDNAVAHVMLYDLLIDRLLFVLQSFTKFNELLLLPSIGDPTKTSSAVVSMSAGLTAKKCWNRMTQSAATMQQLAKELKRQSNALPNEKACMKEKGHMESPEVIQRNHVGTLEENFKESDTYKNQHKVSSEVSNRSCQTHITAYTACETCSRTQACLQDVGKLLIKVCKSQGLPSSLEDFAMRQVEELSVMSIAEMTRWKILQNKDLSRIDRHLDNLMKQVKPLKREVDESKRREQSLSDEVQRHILLSERREKEFSEEMKARESNLLEEQKALKKEVFSLANVAAQLKEHLGATSLQLSNVKDELLQKHRQVVALESEKFQLKEEVIRGKQYQKDAIRLEEEASKLKQQLSEIQENVKSANDLLEKESCKNKTLSSHDQAMNEKQQGLLKRLDELDEECEELRERLSVAEDERDRSEETLHLQKETADDLQKQLRAKEELATVLQQDQETLKRRAEDLSGSVHELENQLEKCAERERLLIAYPDLHKAEIPCMPESSGNVLLDMQRQVEANEIRIAVLQKENRALMKTLGNASSQYVSKLHLPGNEENDETTIQNIKPIQLWKSPPTQERRQRETDELSTCRSGFSVSGSAASFRNKTNRGSRKSSPAYQLPPNKCTASDTRNIVQQQQVSPVRTSFHVGPGKRRSKTPVDARPSSGRSALLKPWT